MATSPRSAATRRRLFIDCETGGLEIFVFQLGDIHVSYENVTNDWMRIICACWQWEGSNAIEFGTWNSRRSDKALVKRLIEVVEEADEVVAHNGKRFDIPYIRTRALFNGLPMCTDIPQVDTLQELRSKFRFPSNRLDSVGRQLLGDHKDPTGLALWKDVVLKNDREQLDGRMVPYCGKDVLLLAETFRRINPYLPARSSIATYARDCPECGSSRTKGHGRRRTVSSVKQRMICRDCEKSWTIALSKANKNPKLAA